MFGHDRILVRALIHKWEHCVLGQLLLFLPELSAPALRGSHLCCRGVSVGHGAAELPQFITKQVKVAPCLQCDQMHRNFVSVRSAAHEYPPQTSSRHSYSSYTR